MESLPEREKEALLGLSCLNTAVEGGADRLSYLLRNSGARVFSAPMLEVRFSNYSKLAGELNGITSLGTKLMLFTSANAVRSVATQLEFSAFRIAVVGEKTAEAVRSFGGVPELISKTPEAMEFAQEIVCYLTQASSGYVPELIWLRGDSANLRFLQVFEEAEIPIRNEVVYFISEIKSEDPRIKAVHSFFHADICDCLSTTKLVLVTSSRGVERLLEIISEYPRAESIQRELQFAAIGPQTAETIARAGYKLAVVADYTSMEALFEGICSWWRNNGLSV